MKYLLDTCAVSDFVKGDQNTLDLIKSCSPADIAISSVTAMEIKFGIALNSNMAQRVRAMLADFMSAVTIIRFGKNDADVAGTIRAELHKKGRLVGAYALLIAATAVANNLTLITLNTREFSQIKPLALEDWRG